MMDSINQNEKAIVFCATQTHAGANPDYWVRVAVRM
jgi:hypothetical protein